MSWIEVGGFWIALAGLAFTFLSALVASVLHYERRFQSIKLKLQQLEYKLSSEKSDRCNQLQQMEEKIRHEAERRSTAIEAIERIFSNFKEIIRTRFQQAEGAIQMLSRALARHTDYTPRADMELGSWTPSDPPDEW